MKYFGLTKTSWHLDDEVPYPDVEEILKYLCEKGYKLGVIANQSEGTAKRLDKWRLLKYIEVVAASAEVGASKPDKIIFEKLYLWQDVFIEKL